MNQCLRCDRPASPSELHYGQHQECFQEVFRVSGKPEFVSLVPKSSTTDRNQKQPSLSIDRHLTSYFGGNYRKYEGDLGGAKYILKLSKPEYPELAAVEFVSNKIAYRCGLKVPTPFTLIAMGEGELAFVSRNFMDALPGHATLNHIYHYKPLEDPDHYTVEDIVKTIYRETKSALDVRTFLRVLLFDALVGNHDRHGRNLALIVNAQHQRLSPIYDNPSYLGLESGAMLNAAFSPRGKIWTKASQEPQMKEYLDELERLGTLEVARDFCKNLSMPKIVEDIDHSSSLSDPMKKALKRLIVSRHEDLEAYLGSTR